MGFGKQAEGALLQGRVRRLTRAFARQLPLKRTSKLTKAPFGECAGLVVDAQKIRHGRNDIAGLVRLFEAVEQNRLAVEDPLGHAQQRNDVERSAELHIGRESVSRSQVWTWT